MLRYRNYFFTALFLMVFSIGTYAKTVTINVDVDKCRPNIGSLACSYTGPAVANPGDTIQVICEGVRSGWEFDGNVQLNNDDAADFKPMDGWFKSITLLQHPNQTADVQCNYDDGRGVSSDILKFKKHQTQ